MSSAQFCFFIFLTQSPKAISATFCFTKSFTWYAICHAIVTIVLAFIFFLQYLCLCLCVPLLYRKKFICVCALRWETKRSEEESIEWCYKASQVKWNKETQTWVMMGLKWFGRSFFAIFCWFYPSTSLFFFFLLLVLLLCTFSFRDKLALHLVWEKNVNFTVCYIIKFTLWTSLSSSSFNFIFHH